MKAPMAESTDAIEIDGSIGEGAGQVLRSCLALSPVPGQGQVLRARLSIDVDVKVDGEVGQPGVVQVNGIGPPGHRS